MASNAAFIFVVPAAEKDRYETVLETPVVNMLFVGVKDYAEAAKVAKEMVQNQEVTAIELCAGFGPRGVALVCEAVGESASVGVVRFDHHPALGFKSGDTVF